MSEGFFEFITILTVWLAVLAADDRRMRWAIAAGGGVSGRGTPPAPDRGARTLSLPDRMVRRRGGRDRTRCGGVALGHTAHGDPGAGGIAALHPVHAGCSAGLIGERPARRARPARVTTQFRVNT